MPNEYDIERLLNTIKVLPTLPPDISKLPSESELKSIVLPPLPPYPKGSAPAIKQSEAIGPGEAQTIAQGTPINASVREEENGDQSQYTIFSTPQVLPLKIKLQSESDDAWWLLPTEPVITIEGKNNIVKRNVAKLRNNYGTIKEYWTQDDWKIKITGLFTSISDTEYPWSDVLKLQKYCEAKETIAVQNPLFEKLGITHIVIENYHLPFTKGSENQKYSIDAVSDKDWDLFIKL